MIKMANNKDELSVVNDQVGSPTYTVDLAKLLVEMGCTDKYGTYNVNNEGYCNWAEFAEYIMKATGKTMKINLPKTAKAVAIVAAVVVTVKVAKAVISKVKSGKKDKVKDNEDVSADITRGCDCENEACDCAGDAMDCAETAG
jgi:dTDP-4-dehydrorhamnose reductase